MRKTRNTMRVALIIRVLLALVLAPLVLASSPAEMLEKAIYTEETLGDLPAAIELYRQIVEDQSKSSRYAAEALLRLGQAESKSGNQAAATSAFQQLIDEFPQQEELIAQARELLSEQTEALTLRRPPWESGELLRYDMRLATGTQIGGIVTTVESMTVDGEDAWRIELLRAVGKHRVISRADFSRDDYKPLSGWFKHSALGEFRVAYHADGAHHEAISLTGETTQVRDFPLDGTVYDNEQSMCLVRQLPLEVGFRASLTFLPFHGQALPVEVEVTARETVEVPAGSFDTYKLEMNIGQTFWISAEPGRHVVRFEGDGMVVELVEIDKFSSGEPASMRSEEIGYGLTLPPGWHRLEFDTRNSASWAVRLLDPEADAVSMLELNRSDDRTLDERVESELKGCKRRFLDYALREEGVQARTIAGLPAKSFVGDYKQDDESWVQYRIYVVGEELTAEFIFRVPADRFDALRESLDSIVESYEVG